MPTTALRWGLALVLLLTACGSSTDATTTTATDADTNGGSVDSIDVPGPGDPWDVLFLGFDDVFTRSVGEEFGGALADDLGVEVRVFEPPGFDHVWAATLVGQLRGDRYPPLDHTVAPAEIIVMLSRPGEADDGADDHIEDDFELCWWHPSSGDAPAVDTTGDYWRVYEDLFAQALDELWALRLGTETSLLVLDLYNPSLAGQREGGVDDACTAWFEAWHDVIVRVAGEKGARVVSLMDAFNGPDHRTDPTDLGLIGPTDADPGAPWYRLTPDGVELMVETLVAAGIEPMAPSG